MSVFDGINTSASALTAQRLRMDVTSSNIANAQSTRATTNENGEYEPYRRKMVVTEPREKNFQSFLQTASKSHASKGSGVKVSEIAEDQEPFKMINNPNHPEADDDGYVQMPNVDPLKEMTDLMSSTRSYEANVTSLNANKTMLQKALEIGKQ